MYNLSMLLNDYIDKHGAESCANKFDVTVGCVYHWRKGIRKPRPNQALIIVERTLGEVSLSDIYQQPNELAA